MDTSLKTSETPQPVYTRIFSPRAFDLLITGTQVMIDMVTVFASYMASYIIYTSTLGRESPQTFDQFLLFSVFCSVLYVIVLERVGMYRREMSLLNIKELRGIFTTAIYSAAIILAISFYWRSINFSRITLSIALVAAPTLLYFQRQVFYRLHVMFHQRGWSKQHVLIYGAGQIGIHLARRMFESPSLGLLPVAFLDDDETKHGKNVKWNGVGPKDGLPTMGGIDELSKATALGVNSVFIALPSATFQRNQELVDVCVKERLDYAIVPNAYEKFIQNIELFEIGGIPILRRRENSVSVVYLFVKRLIDFFLSMVMIVLLAPLILVFGILIKLDSKGPVLFKQKRVGLKGREFSFYKFRTMHVDAPKYAVTPKDSSDPRITRIGRWLRRTSLDELPQLYNVFRGDMSFVGPRPEMPFIVAEYTELQRRRLEAKPGITGVWQISAVRGEPIHANLEYDLFYLENRSLLLDCAILVKTFLSVIKGVGAV